MSRAAAAFRQRDVAAAIKAVKAAGYQVLRLEVEAGKIVVVTTEAQEGAAAPSSSEDASPEDALLEAIHARKASLRHPAG
jgi:hypothetical protein